MGLGRRDVLRGMLGTMAALGLALLQGRGRAAAAGSPTPSDHWDGRRFFNPEASTDKGLGDLLRWLTSGQKSRWPDRVADPAFPPPPSELAPGAIAVTPIGHATCLVLIGGLTILTDPMFSDRAGPLGLVGPRRVRPPALPLDRLPPIDLVLLSHNHYDHLDLPSLRAIRDRWDPPVVTALGLGDGLRAAGFSQVDELDWWQPAAGPRGARITFVPAQHFSGRGLFDRNRTLWGGFIVEAGSAVLYFAGDSGYFSGFQQIGTHFPRIDLALLPIGAYAPRWFMKPAHMNPDEAVSAHLDLAARLSVPIHFGTFQLTDEAIEAPVEALRAALAARRVPPDRFPVPGFGETMISMPA